MNQSFGLSTTIHGLPCALYRASLGSFVIIGNLKKYILLTIVFVKLNTRRFTIPRETWNRIDAARLQWLLKLPALRVSSVHSSWETLLLASRMDTLYYAKDGIITCITWIVITPKWHVRTLKSRALPIVIIVLLLDRSNYASSAHPFSLEWRCSTPFPRPVSWSISMRWRAVQ